MAIVSEPLPLQVVLGKSEDAGHAPPGFHRGRVASPQAGTKLIVGRDNPMPARYRRVGDGALVIDRGSVFDLVADPDRTLQPHEPDVRFNPRLARWSGPDTHVRQPASTGRDPF